MKMRILRKWASQISPVHLTLWLTFLLSTTWVGAADQSDRMDTAIQALNGRGVACVPACGEGAAALELARKSGFLILALDEDPAKEAKAKEQAAAAGLLGRQLYVEQGTLEALPFADYYVDLIALPNLAKSDLTEKGRAEILRVLTPIRGRAVLKDEIIEKPDLPGSDWWTHKLHGPNNNPVSEDTVFQFPPIMQYRAMPMYTTAFSAALTAQGIQIEINDWLIKTPVRANLAGRIIARSAYNGQILWDALAPENTTPNTPTLAVTDSALLMASGADGSVLRRDIRTGQELEPWVLAGSDRRVKWLAHQDGVLYVLMGNVAAMKGAFTFYVPVLKDQWENHTLFGDELIAWDMDRNREIWRHKEPERIDYRNVGVHGRQLVFYTEKIRLACLGTADGSQIWENRDAEWVEKLNRPARPGNPGNANVSSLIVNDSVIRLAVTGGKLLFLFNPADGRLMSSTPGNNMKTVILDNKMVSGNRVFDALSGQVLDEKVLSATGSAWCGMVTYAPGTGILGHSTLGYKAACAAGAWVAGGILSYSPTICDCGAVPGAGAYASGADVLNRAETSPEHPLVQGPAFGRPPTAKASDKDWTAYRGDYRHRGSSQATVPDRATIAWTTASAKPFDYATLYNQFVLDYDDRPVAPIVAGEMVYSAGSDGLVQSRSLQDGKLAWTFHADGPVLTSPAWAEGLLFVPGGDGWAYALDARTGELAWKRRLAPLERRILLFEQLCSTWPVISLVAHEGTVYATAGHNVTDGAYAFALDARTGETRWRHYSEPAQTSFQGTHNPPDRPVQGFGGSMTVLGDRVWAAGYFSSPLTLDRATGDDSLKELKGKLVLNTSFVAARQLLGTRGQDLIALGDDVVLTGGGDLFENQHMREGKRRRTAYDLFFANEQGDWVLEPAPPEVFISRIAPAADDKLFAYAGPASFVIKEVGQDEEVSAEEAAQGVRTTDSTTLGLNVWSMEGFMKQARAMQQESVLDKERSEKDPRGRIFLNRAARFRFFPHDQARWQKGELDVNAIALAANAIVVAHAGQRENLFTWSPAVLGKRQPLVIYESWKVSAFHRETGETMWSLGLPSEPLLNGLAVAANGSILVSLRDGRLLAIGE